MDRRAAGSGAPIDVPLAQDAAIAMAFPSVLSIPYALDAVAPKLAAALKNGA